MIDNLTFLRETWLWYIGAAGAVLWLIFLWKEWSQSGKQRFVLKALIALIAVCALVLIALQPMIEKRVSKGVGVLLTKNYISQQLDSLQNQYQGIPVLEYEPTMNLRPSLDSIGSFFLLGEGIAAYDFWQFDEAEVNYLGGKMPSGITQIAYDKEYQIGDSLMVRGDYRKPKIGNRLVLEDPAGNPLDSIALLDSNSQTFKLRSPLSVAGNFVYAIVEKDSVHTVITTDPVPITVHGQRSLEILMVSSFPTFEKKYLKNFLAEDGHRLLVRSQLTKDRYKFEAFNREQGAVYGFTKENLATIDLLILDAPSYFGLSGASRRAMERAVSEEGMGVFIQPDPQLFNAASTRSYFAFSRSRSTSVRLEAWPRTPVSLFPYAFAKAALQYPILSGNNQTIAAYHLKGAGKVGTTVLQNTHQLVLNGNNDVYSYLWSTLLSDLGKQATRTANWEVNKKTARLDEPLSVSLRTLVARPEVIYNATAKIPLRSDIDLKDYWEGEVYPDRLGWNRLSIGQDSTAVFHFYVGDSSVYTTKETYDRTLANKRAFGQQVKKLSETIALEPVNRFWLFVVFVLAIGFLWMEPRFFGS